MVTTELKIKFLFPLTITILLKMNEVRLLADHAKSFTVILPIHLTKTESQTASGNLTTEHTMVCSDYRVVVEICFT